ncbi:hypothetical protein R3W88_014965 [Solanum pinnatisectum]|uniref:Uncharacterized protein n=1 Tax=Solanum pinnatisectum TaxID=50273 RepID=A0AAV9KUC8_9SOLN|nr:hypothetical protein R3W88_014965 [Solanum pinnatisectum]
MCVKCVSHALLVNFVHHMCISCVICVESTCYMCILCVTRVSCTLHVYLVHHMCISRMSNMSYYFNQHEYENLGIDYIGKFVVYGSDQTHSTYSKACKVAGIFPCKICAVPTSTESDFALSPIVLRIDADVAAGLVPLFLCATVGTTSTTTIDPLSQLGQLAKEFNIWLHVDAAYRGSACICLEFRQYLDGIERANLLSLSPHKWLLSYLECCCMWVKEPNMLIKALSMNLEYLRNKLFEYDSVFDYKDYYGVANLQSHIRSNVRMDKTFEGLVRSDSRFDVVVPRRFSLMCFRFNRTRNMNGGTPMGGIYMLRFAVGATFTEDRHVILAWKLIKESAKALLNKNVF